MSDKHSKKIGMGMRISKKKKWISWMKYERWFCMLGSVNKYIVQHVVCYFIQPSKHIMHSGEWCEEATIIACIMSCFIFCFDFKQITASFSFVELCISVFVFGFSIVTIFVQCLRSADNIYVKLYCEGKSALKFEEKKI